tara:strand:- start:520 stop:690 length:171 start_codon:yes stop_codon:yes gene_type:complete
MDIKTFDSWVDYKFELGKMPYDVLIYHGSSVGAPTNLVKEYKWIKSSKYVIIKEAI